MSLMQVRVTVTKLRAGGGLGKARIVAREAQSILAAVVLAVREGSVDRHKEILERASVHAMARAAVAMVHRTMNNW
jgi:hypothetical protein